jgi:hypothetical protein
MTVGTETGGGLVAPSDAERAEYEQEKPARRLRPALDQTISVWCGIVSIGVLLQVFFPFTTRHAVLLGDLSRSRFADHVAVLSGLEGPSVPESVQEPSS